VDLTTPLPRRLDSVGLKYAAWHGDVPHEVARVTQPFRVVLLYRLFKRGDVPRALMARPLVDDVRRHFASIFGDMRSETPRQLAVASENFRWQNDDGYYPKCKRTWRCPASASSCGTPIRQRDCVRTR
jgi:hypothetical protein